MPRAGLLFLFTLAACSAAGGARRGVEGELEARWSGAGGPALLIAPAEASWCARDSMLEILAVRNDSAVGIALYARDSLRVEAYPIFVAGVFAPWRPQATAALRLLTSSELQGFESHWGQVHVTEVGAGRVSGTFDLHLKRAAATDSVQVTGQFTHVPIRPAGFSCGRANKPPSR